MMKEAECAEKSRKATRPKPQQNQAEGNQEEQGTEGYATMELDLEGDKGHKDHGKGAPDQNVGIDLNPHRKTPQ